MSLKGKKIALYVADMYEDMEFWYPHYRFLEEDAEVAVVGPKLDTYKGKKGTSVKADLSVIGLTTDEFSAVVIPGGYAPDHMRRTPEMVEFLKRMHDDGKPVAAICHAGWMLASAGLLDGRTVTSFFSIRKDLENAGAEWIDREVVHDGNIITSRKPDDLPAFCKAIIGALN